MRESEELGFCLLFASHLPRALLEQAQDMSIASTLDDSPDSLRQEAPVSSATLVATPPLRGALASGDVVRASLNAFTNNDASFVRCQLFGTTGAWRRKECLSGSARPRALRSGADGGP